MNKLHTSREYERELKMLQRSLIKMAQLVEEMVVSATQAVISGDKEAAKRIIEMDKQVDRAEMQIDESCLLMLARRQPLGQDLRFVTTTLKMVTDLERMADLAAGICHRMIKAGPSNQELHPLIVPMAKLSHVMVREAIEAFSENDASCADRVIARDDEMDDFYHQVTRQMFSSMGNHEAVEWLVYSQHVAKWLERLGDHCTNLAELVIFMIRGIDVRHATPKAVVR